MAVRRSSPLLGRAASVLQRSGEEWSAATAECPSERRSRTGAWYEIDLGERRSVAPSAYAMRALSRARREAAELHAGGGSRTHGPAGTTYVPAGESARRESARREEGLSGGQRGLRPASRVSRRRLGRMGGGEPRRWLLEGANEPNASIRDASASGETDQGVWTLLARHGSERFGPWGSGPDESLRGTAVALWPLRAAGGAAGSSAGSNGESGGDDRGSGFPAARANAYRFLRVRLTGKNEQGAGAGALLDRERTFLFLSGFEVFGILFEDPEP
jgi:hypothetical protein